MDTYEKKIREYLNNGEVDELYKNMLLNLFPELKESEDERIRKAIHIYLDWLDGRNKDYQPKGDYSIKDMIAWLEKQGMEINPTEFDTRLQTLIGKFDNLPKEELIGSLSFWLNVVQNDGTYKDEEKQGEQKPQRMISAEAKEAMYDKPALNEKDEQHIDSLLKRLDGLCRNEFERTRFAISEDRDWLTSLKERIGE